MKKNMFISYSHKDESFKESFEEHLSSLKRNGLISVWNDRKISAGDEWKEKIDSNLENADIIIFLISSSFIASDYCCDVEVKKAIEMHNSQKACVIPIIVRSCDWKGSCFSHLQCLPKDAKAINSWEDQDDAWVDTVKKIKEKISSFTFKEKNNDIEEITKDIISISEKTKIWLSDTEIKFHHRKMDSISISDIYISTDLKIIDQQNNELKTTDSDLIFKKQNKYLIIGEEQQGKTTLLKNAYSNFLLNGYLPVYLNASNINKSNENELISKALKEQYSNLEYDKYIHYENKVILIDNLDQLGINDKYRNVLINKINAMFGWVIITSHDSIEYILPDITSLGNYNTSTILSFGHVKREALIQKWISLGIEEQIQECDLYSQCDELKLQLNSVIKKNIVPSKPIYVLMLIQMFESYSKQNLELTSYGHCYQQLIYKSFETAKIKNKDTEKYLNVLTELAWDIFLNKKKGLNQNDLDIFFTKYGEVYLSVNKNEVITKLTKHSILCNEKNLTSFKYPYLYYFFVGKKIAEGFNSFDFIKDKINDLLNNSHREDYANILIFITHHTKDSYIFEKLKYFLIAQFHNQKMATLSKDELSFMSDFVKSIPNLVLEQKEIQAERNRSNKKLDKIENKHNVDESNELLVNINKTFKGMEIAGQIIRNRHATMTRLELYELANTGLASGLRFLDYFIKVSDVAKKEITSNISEQLYNEPSLTISEIKETIENLYLQLTYGVINGVIKKIADSMGSKEAFEIFCEIKEKENSFAHTLIKYAIELQFQNNIDIHSLTTTFNEVKQSEICKRILKELVIQHIYMYPVPYKEKQQVSEILKITIQQQRLMELKTTLQK